MVTLEELTKIYEDSDEERQKREADKIIAELEAQIKLYASLGIRRHHVVEQTTVARVYKPSKFLPFLKSFSHYKLVNKHHQRIWDHLVSLNLNPQIAFKNNYYESNYFNRLYKNGNSLFAPAIVIYW